MKKIYTIAILLVLSLLLVSCKKDGDDNDKTIVTHQMVFTELAIGYGGTDSSLSVTGNIELKTTSSYEGVTINWISANENIISTTGVVNRPEKNNAEILLMLEVTIDGVKDTRSFTLVVIATNPNGGGDETKEYTITFNTNGGSTIVSQKVKENHQVIRPSNPTKAGYDFVGWYLDNDYSEEYLFNTVVTESFTLYALWEVTLPSYAVTFDSTGGSAVNSVNVKEGKTFDAPTNPTRDGYDFVDWYQDSELEVIWNFETDTVTKAITLYAKWQRQTVYHTVSFDTVGGNYIDELLVEEETSANIPVDPLRDNYDFAGWYLDYLYETAYTFSELVTEDITLYAKWVPEGADINSVIYRVSFETYSEFIQVVDEFVLENGKVNKPADLVRPGYRFDGWFTNGDLDVEFDFDSEISSDITIYVKWWELPPQLPAPIHGIGTQPRPVAHLGIGPYEFDAGLNGGFIGFGFVFNNTTTGEKFVWLVNATLGQGSDFYYTETNLANAGIVLTGGNYVLNYYARGNGTTTSDSDYSSYTTTFNIPNPPLGKVTLSFVGNTVVWNNVHDTAKYELYINDVLESDNATSPFDLSTLEEPGSYVIRVVAKADGFENSTASITYVVANLEADPLDAPTNLVVDNNNLSWDAVAGAVGYNVTVSGITIKVTETNINLARFELSGNHTAYVVAIGDIVNNVDSEPATIAVVLATLLPRLDAMGAGDHNGDLNGYGNGHYRIIAHLGHPPFQQEDWDGKFRIKVYDGDNLLGEKVIANGEFLHMPGSSTDFYGALLEDGNTYQVHVQLVAKDGSGHRDSAALVLTFTYTK